MIDLYRILALGAILSVVGGHWLLILSGIALYKGRNNPTTAYELFNHFAPIGFATSGIGVILSILGMVLIAIANAGSY